MKRMVWIGIVFFLVVAACARPDTDPVETRRATSLPPITVSPELSAIDSLMWRQPDSALACLLPYFDTCCRDAKFCVSTTTAYNRHYAHLLLAELLYKNDYPQTNRPALQQAVVYFDSLVRPAPPFKGAGGIKKDLNPNPNLAFLDARAHYIHGVGYYENDSVVEACKEYLKALEVMESHFQEKDLVGKKARFMTYTYNRLGELFSEQYMMESAILCYKEAQVFCEIEPTSPQGISNNYYRIGIQYNKMGDKDTAMYYYNKALENLEDSNCLMYRNIKSNKALLCYQISKDAESAVQELITIAQQSEDESERLTRYFTIGDILYEDGNYDSAKLYLERVYEQKDDEISRIQVAEYLRHVYEEMGNMEKADAFVRFLADHKKLDDENKPLVSKLKDLFQTHLNQKQEKQAEEAREKSVRKTIGIIIPIAVLLAFVIIVLARQKRRKQLKEQQKEADRKLGETEQQHRMQQAALSGRLKRSNEELRDVSKKLEQSLSKNALNESDTSNDYAAFINDPICKHIVGIAHKQQFKSKMDYLIYKDDALSKEQILDLRNAVQKHLPRFVSYIRRQYPKLTDNDMDYCYLVLLGLNEADISALMQRAYTTVCDRSRKISRIIGTHDSLYHTLRNMLDE